MNKSLRVLIVEDSQSDAMLEVRMLEKGGYQVTFRVVDNAARMKAALEEESFDIVLSDHALPQFDAPGALAVLNESRLDIPFIIVSGAIGEEAAVVLIKAGAYDYVSKGRLSLLSIAVINALKDTENLRERVKAEMALREIEEQYRLLAEHIQDTVWLMDMNLKITYQSPSVQKLRGFTLQEISEMPLEKHMTAESYKIAADAFIEELVKMEADPGYDFIRTLELEFYRKDGTTFWSENKFSLIRDENGRPLHILGEARDITERKEAEEQLRESERVKSDLFHKLNEAQHIAMIGSWEWDLHSDNVWWSDETYRIFGVNRQDYIPSFEANGKFIHPDDLEKYGKSFEHSLQTGEPLVLDVRLVAGDGQLKSCHAMGRVIYDDAGKPIQFIGTVMDITERKKAEEAVQQSEKLYSSLFENMLNGFAYCKMLFDNDRPVDLIYLSVNAAFEKQTGLKDITGKRITEVLPGILEADPHLIEIYGRVALTGIPEALETYSSAMGQWLSISLYSPQKGYFVAVFDVITERKQAELALLEANERLGIAQEASRSGVWDWDVASGVLKWSPELFRLLGLNPSENTASFETWSAVLHPDHRQIAEERINEAIRDHTRLYNEYRIILPTGEVHWIAAWGDTHYDNQGNAKRMMGICIDMTEGKQAREAIIKSKLLLQAVIDSIPDWVCVKDSGHKYLLVNKSFAAAQDTTPQNIIGKADNEFFSEELCLGNPDKSITGYHIDDDHAFTGRVVHNPRNIVTWSNGIEHIYDTYKIPLADQSGEIYGILVYSRDITYQSRIEEERELAIASLRRSMHSLIDTMAKVVEVRDPYTAGHQRRVAALTGAIAREMGMSDDTIEYLVMAATIHDIGKMYVPADILGKPGKLSGLEYSLIKTHPQGSFDILSDIEFSRPVALMVLQHHERLDGSGYPNALKGDEIMIESKIVAVADVVEAMSSHRPYRPAPGLEKALEEISRGKGKLYDADVVDICLKLFNEKRFQFEGEA